MYRSELEKYEDWEQAMAIEEELATKYVEYLTEKGITIKGGILISQIWRTEQNEISKCSSTTELPTLRRQNKKRAMESTPSANVAPKRRRTRQSARQN